MSSFKRRAWILIFSTVIFYAVCKRFLKLWDYPTMMVGPSCIEQLEKALYGMPQQKLVDEINPDDTILCGSLLNFGGKRPLISAEERAFPIAYAITTYESFLQLARLLRLVYRPHNIYCVHVDAKSSQQYFEKVSKLVECFGNNVFMVPEAARINVSWGDLTSIETMMICADLLRKQQHVKWRYFMNINEKEFPLRTNWEIVKALKALNQSNLVDIDITEPYTERFPKLKSMYKIDWIKGLLFAALKREFVDYLFSDMRPIDLWATLRTERNVVKLHDELFFSSLAYNPQLKAPGACTNRHMKLNNDTKSWYLARYVRWKKEGCISKYIRRHVCILGWSDSQILLRQPHLFANKFMPNFEPQTYDCLEHWLAGKIVNEREIRKTDPKFNVKWYKELYCTQDHM